jgi:hypothetical protein
MPHEKTELETADDSNQQLESPIRPWQASALKSAEMSPAERRDEIIAILARGFLRMTAAGRIQAENSSN